MGCAPEAVLHLLKNRQISSQAAQQGPRRMPIRLNSIYAIIAAVLTSAAIPARSNASDNVIVTDHVLQAFRPPTLPAPPKDPASRARLQLGRMLFFDPILSRNAAMSCATCHNPGLSWSNGLPHSIGDTGDVMALRSPTLIDLGQIDTYGWDGKYPDVEAVTFGAISGHANMDLPEADAITRLKSIPGYVAAFQAAFPGQGVTPSTVSEAVAAFELTIVSGASPFDRFVAGDAGAISAEAKRGFLLFTGKAGCVQCHSGWSFTDGSFHDIGTASGPDIGRGRLFPTSIKLKYAFKVPTLRDVARRAPYMHDGSLPDLSSVIALYDKGGIDRPSRDPLIHPLHLSAGEKAELIAFLYTLTESPHPTLLPVLPR